MLLVAVIAMLGPLAVPGDPVAQSLTKALAGPDAAARRGGLLVIIHDLALARRIDGRLIVLREGAVVETGAIDAVFADPKEPYTRDLIAANPETWAPRRRAVPGSPVLSADGLAAECSGRGVFSDLSLELSEGEVLGITGPSGCGKSMLGDTLLGPVPPAAGTITRASGLPATAFQKLYQDPVVAFPRHRTLGRVMDDVTHRHDVPPSRVETRMTRLGLSAVLLSRRPAAVSGGELQRLALLRFLLLRPKFIFADEPTSRLDPITQAQVIALLAETAEREGCAIALVSHDAALVRTTADSVLPLGPAPERPAQDRDLAAAVLP